MIESTEGGSWLDGRQAWDRDDPIWLLESGGEQAAPNAEAQALWDRASDRYATVVALRGQPAVALWTGAREDGTYRRVERPILIRGGDDLDER